MFRRTIFAACAVALTAATASTASAAGYGYSGYQQKAAPAYRAKSAYNGDNAHVRWCYNTYRSYRISDNSFQPYDGPRKACVSPHVAARLALFPEAAPAAPAAPEAGGLRDQFGNLTEAPPPAAPAAADVDGARDEFGNLAEGAPAASAPEASPAEDASAEAAPDENAGVEAQVEAEGPEIDEAPAAASGDAGEDESGADNS